MLHNDVGNNPNISIFFPLLHSPNSAHDFLRCWLCVFLLHSQWVLKSLTVSRFPLQSFKTGKLNSPATPEVRMLRRTITTGKTWNKKWMADASLFYSVITCTLGWVPVHWNSQLREPSTQQNHVCRAGLALSEGNSPQSAQCSKHLPSHKMSTPSEMTATSSGSSRPPWFGRTLLELHTQAFIFWLASWWPCFSQSTPSLSHFASPFSTIPLVKVKPIWSFQ